MWHVECVIYRWTSFPWTPHGPSINLHPLSQYSLIHQQTCTFYRTSHPIVIIQQFDFTFDPRLFFCHVALVPIIKFWDYRSGKTGGGSGKKIHIIFFFTIFFFFLSQSAKTHSIGAAWALIIEKRDNGHLNFKQQPFLLNKMGLQRFPKIAN